MPRLGRAVLFLAIFLCTTGFDQASKQWAQTLPVAPVVRATGCQVPADLIAGYCAGVPQPVIHGMWDWELAMNTGVAFSTLEHVGGSQIVLALIAAIALIVLGIAAARTRPEQRLRLAALALIGGGTLGNLVDRIRDGAVTDFIRWHAGSHAWPIFNVADAALFVGVVLVLIESALAKRRRAILQT
jgi:signal peptidase II